MQLTITDAIEDGTILFLDLFFFFGFMFNLAISAMLLSMTFLIVIWEATPDMGTLQTISPFFALAPMLAIGCLFGFGVTHDAYNDKQRQARLAFVSKDLEKRIKKNKFFNKKEELK